MEGFEPLNWMDKKDVKKMDRFIQFAIAAADFALRDSGLRIEPANADRVGVYIGSGIGGFATIEREMHERCSRAGRDKSQPVLHPRRDRQPGLGLGLHPQRRQGPNSATCTACATAPTPSATPTRMIQHGEADVMLAGGAEAAITPLGVGGFAAMRALSTRNDDPATASRPFDKDRDGFVIGEGAGVLMLEELEHARRRGASIYAELVGYGMSSDAFHISAPCEDGDGAIRAMRQTLADAGRGPRRTSTTSTPTAPPPPPATRSRSWPSSRSSASTPAAWRSAPPSR